MLNVLVGMEGGNLNPVLDSFGFDTSNYVLSPETSEALVTYMLKEVLHNSTNSGAEVLVAASRYGETRFFRVQDIYYFESFGKLKCVNTVHGAFEFYGVLDRIEKCMECLGFLRIHNSYIISLQQISCASARYVRMRNGKIINVGEKYLQRYREAVCTMGLCQVSTRNHNRIR